MGHIRVSSVRRCLECGYKTRKSMWKSRNACPICESGLGYIESDHGALDNRQIKAAREAFVKTMKELVHAGKER